MFGESNNSKEVIKNRMLKHALNYWGISNTEDIDPAVKLMLEALSSELYNLGNEIKDTQVRILEKVANLLSPDFLTAPAPAHTLLYANPAEPVQLLSQATAFSCQRKISSNQNDVLDTTLDIQFTPVSDIDLFDIQIMHTVTGGKLFTHDTVLTKQIAGQGRQKTSTANALWLGIRINPNITSLENLFFCFDWKNIEPKLAQRIYQLLPLTRWLINDEELQIRDGLPELQAKKSNSYHNIFSSYDLAALLEKDIRQYYHHKYIYITDSRQMKLHSQLQYYPASFTQIFTENELQKFTEKLLWIQILFPVAMQQEYLDELYIYPNTFPAINRHANDLKFRLKGGSNIIPLKTGLQEQFLSVKSLADSVRQYRSVPYRDKEEEESGTYTLRTGGVERFDNRNARELIGYLLELLRSESAAFSTYGYDYIAITLKEMNQKMALMEQKTKGYASNAAEIPNYIIVKPFENEDMMYAEYWTTLAEMANNLRAGTPLQLMKGAGVKQDKNFKDQVFMMTTTTGGKSRLKSEERLNALRYGIMTRNRIITKEDIRNFCFYELGDRISKVNIERGFELSTQTKEAFRKTIDIKLTPSDSGILDKSIWHTLCDQLLAKLNVRSGASGYYRVLVDN